MLAPHETYTDEGLASLTAQGFTEPVFGIEVINVGRLATTVQDWSIVFGNKVTRTSEDGWGPRLPYRLEPHTGASWYHHAFEVQRWQSDFVDQSDNAATARATVTLPGRVVLSVDRLVIRSDSVRTVPPSRMRKLARFFENWAG